MSIPHSELSVTFKVKPTIETSWLMKSIRIKLAHPIQGSVGSLYALHIFRSRCSNRFLEAMDMESEEMYAFGTTLFDKFGRIKPHIVSKGYRSGTGCWGEELSEGQIIYITHIDVSEKYQRQGVGSLLLDKLFNSEHVQDKDFVMCWPFPISREKSDDSGLRVGKTKFFGYSPLPHHPSRLVHPETDANYIGDNFCAPSPTEEELKIHGPDFFRNQREENSPLHYSIVGDMTAAIADTIQLFFDKDPLSISRPDPDGLRPIFIAAASENIHAVRKLLELGVRHDLFDFENGDGLTPLEMLQGSMRSLREFSETLLPCWSGYPDSSLRIEYLLKSAMGISVDGLSDHEYISRNKYGCTCGHCGAGWLSPRMRFQLSCQAGYFRDIMPDSLEYFTPRQAIDIHTLLLVVASDYLPQQLHSSLYKTFYAGYISIFGALYNLLENSSASFSLDIVNQVARNDFSADFYFQRGGKVEYALDAITDSALNQSLLGDGEFHAVFDDDKDYRALPKCANDLEFQLVRDMLGLTADRPWGPYSSHRNRDPSEMYVDSEDSEEDEDDSEDEEGMLF
ncbi:ankyrin repeat family protein [Desarmillaria tabescens]|uniref:Ankyrin repeat family protein n=1 Tax=Armillaria tabescens TaxID=1929756 RepID=A0AA39TWM9_ARMTA|nr:ankyrin repeat family protein [Desarmillaria tabescens]KAK0461730.1 ankyrin repeat family protein [Desarmillaria tabescens]